MHHQIREVLINHSFADSRLHRDDIEPKPCWIDAQNEALTLFQVPLHEVGRDRMTRCHPVAHVIDYRPGVTVIHRLHQLSGQFIYIADPSAARVSTAGCFAVIQAYVD